VSTRPFGILVAELKSSSFFSPLNNRKVLFRLLIVFTPSFTSFLEALLGVSQAIKLDMLLVPNVLTLEVPNCDEVDLRNPNLRGIVGVEESAG
jgi:hypothetical protein